MQRLLEIRSLTTCFFNTGSRAVTAVNGVDLHIDHGESVALVGESGSGKTVTALSLFRLVPPPGKIVAGEIQFKGKNLLQLTSKEMRSIRGCDMGFVMQDPMSALNPVLRVGEQIAEVLRTHKRLTRRQARIQTLDLMRRVQLPGVEHLYRMFPHQLSGGQRQRILIAAALACGPSLLVADEPTTALDVSIQGQILNLLYELKRDLGLSLLLITHDLGIVARIADRVAVMYAGRIVEEAPTRELFSSPAHPYTVALLKSIPQAEFSQNGNGPTFQVLPGMAPDLADLPSGCAFHPRCELAGENCTARIPENTFVSDAHVVKCFLKGD